MGEERQIEHAEALQERERDEAIAARRRAIGRQSDEPRFADWDGVACFDCGGALPPIRLHLGRVRCVLCQQRAERRGDA